MSVHTRAVARFASVSPVLIGVLLVVSAVLADLHVFVLAPEAGEAEPAQWTGRVGLMLYYLLIPLALLALWARHRDRLRRIGAVGAALIAVQVPCYLILTVATLAWGLVLGRGDVSGPFMVFESVGVLSLYLGIVVLSFAFAFAGRYELLVGALILGGFVASFAGPFLFTAVYVVLGGVLLAGKRRPVSDFVGEHTSVPAH